ncbi:hypothetical protein HpHA44_14830 [Helicobacter pylori]
MLKEAISLVKQAHLLIIIGTSLQVYPAASLYTHVHKDALIYYIDPKAKNAHLPKNVNFKRSLSFKLNSIKNHLEV